jgi:hypothetical protein
LPADLAGKVIALIQDIIESAPAIVDEADDAPTAAPDWLTPKGGLTTVKNGD